MSDINTPAPDDLEHEPETKRPPDEMSSYNIDVPPTEDGEIPGCPTRARARRGVGGARLERDRRGA